MTCKEECEPIDVSSTKSFYTCDPLKRGVSIDSASTIEPKQEDASTVAPSIGESSSDRSFLDFKVGIEAIQWSNVKYSARIRPCRRHAHCVDDIYMLSIFLELTQLPDIDPDSVKLLLRAIKLLRLCNYSTEDVCSMLAHASAYFLDAYSKCGSTMDASEVGNILVTLLFVAQCYVQDEVCPLHVWHKHLFRKYCPLSTLNAAIIRLMELRGFIMRLEDEDLSYRYGALYASTQKSKAESSAGYQNLSSVTTTTSNVEQRA